MKYVQTQLMSGEEVVHTAKYSWIIYLPAIVLSCVGIGLFLFPIYWLRTVTDEFAVTNKRVIIKTGLISRRTMELNLAKIENIGVDQGILARILNYGKVTLIGTGGTINGINDIDNPLEFRRVVQELSH